MLEPKFSHRDLSEKRDALREKRAQGKENVVESVVDAGSRSVNRAQGGGGANRRNGSVGSGTRSNGNGQSKRPNGVNTKNDNRKSVNNSPSRNEPALTTHSMQVNSGRDSRADRDKEDCGSSNKNPLARSTGCESIAETMTRTQLILKPEDSQMRKNKSQLVGSGNRDKFPHRYPKIRYVQWDRLTDDTKEIVENY